MFDLKSRHVYQVAPGLPILVLTEGRCHQVKEVYLAQIIFVELVFSISFFLVELQLVGFNRVRLFKFGLLHSYFDLRLICLETTTFKQCC